MAEAPASSAIFACSTFMTSMMTLWNQHPFDREANIDSRIDHRNITTINSPSLEHLCQTSLDTESASSTTACSGSVCPVHDVWSGRSVRVAVGGGR